MELTAEAILKMSAKDAASLFPGGETAVRKGCAKLAAKWHPDICHDPRASDVFSHLLSLRRQDGGRRSTMGKRRTFRAEGGREFAANPLSCRPVDLGEILVGRQTVSTLFSADQADLSEREALIGNLFRFADDKMKAQMAPFLPRIVKAEQLDNGGSLVIAEKTPDEILLADLLALRGAMPDVHAAWLCSGLMNIAAFLEYCGIVHGAIAPDVVLIDPAKHSVRLAASWAFATHAGERPVALPGRTLSLIPRLAVKGQLAETSIDRELVRQTIREALGDPRGSSGGVAALPAPLRNWLNMPPAASSCADYAAWQSALVSAWGKRSFVAYDVRSSDIYDI